MVRVLVPYKTGKLPVHVVFIPTARDQLIPGLIDGRGDVAAAGLTITPDRQAQVDFSDPTFSDVKEIAVTGPGSPPLQSLDDLSGKHVFVHKSSSYSESLTALNARLAKEGEKLVELDVCPD